MEPLNHIPTVERLGAHAWTLETLIEGARAGNDAHIGELSKRFSERLMAKLYRTHPVFACEIATDTFMALPKLLEKYEHQGTFEGWLYVVAFQRLRTRMRTERNDRLTSDSGLDARPGGRTVGRTMEQQETVRFLLSHLDERQRIVWTMLEDGYTSREVALHLDLKENLVHQIRFRAKRKLVVAARAFLDF